ncbi:MAG: type II secretion system protein GspG [Deltaproteobacteria bacterium]|nr:type II secretion system protein GspG [Deltaproteobacteria bacterium]
MKEVNVMRAARRAGRQVQRGMTMLEIMIVLAIIGLVMSVVGVGVYSNWKRAQVKTAQIAVNEIAQKTIQYMTDNNNECPKSVDDLVAQKYMPQKRKDPWNRDYILRCPGQINTDGFDIVSLGPDGQEGTKDDIKAAEQ